jgi:ribose 1,5-bisphosphokinase
MTGGWAFVVGASGAGKDSVIGAAQKLLVRDENIVFARRLVTRPSQAGSEHDAISKGDFQLMAASGGLIWHWQAHGYCYGIASHYTADVSAGRLVVVNGSRAHTSCLVQADDVKVVEISASKIQVASRLQQRGRDDPQAIASRLVRNESLSQVKADFVVVNDSALAASGEQLASYLLGTAQLVRQRQADSMRHFQAP